MSEKKGGAASQGSPGDWVRVDYDKVHREVPAPILCLQQDFRRATSVSGDNSFFSIKKVSNLVKPQGKEKE